MSASGEASGAKSKVDRDELVRGCQGLVRSLAWQEHQRIGKRIELDDLIQYGQMGLLRAAERYDPELGNAFTTYAYHCIHGAILDGLRELKWFNIHHYYGRRYESISRSILEEPGAPGGAAGEGPGSMQEDANWVASVSGRLAVAYLISSLDGKEGDAAERVADVDADAPDATAMLTELKGLLRDLLEQLPRQVRDLLYGVYFEGQTLTDVGARMGMSKFKASRMHTEALEKLAGALRRRGLAPG